ncbi:hypothetical protein WJX74_007013 [Apatococcus lobatus]|uniref:Uncharacterized protein n=1 Tax=Apatococcus lobatus TaxID=904363 RepID=A0AAW1RGH3_9CHLO
MPALVAAQNVPNLPPPQPFGLPPGPAPAAAAHPHSFAHHSAQVQLHAAASPYAAVPGQINSGASPQLADNGTSGSLLGCGPVVSASKATPSPAQPHAAANLSGSSGPPVSGPPQQAHKRSAEAQPADEPGKKRGAPKDSGQMLPRTLGKCVEQAHKDPADVPHNVSLKDGHKKKCQNVGKFVEACLDDELRKKMNRVLKPPKPKH